MTVIEHHTQKLQIVADRAIEAAAAHFKLGLLGNFKWKHRQVAIWATQVGGSQALAHFVIDVKCGAAHFQWVKQVVLQVLAQGLAADFFNHLASPIDVDAVLPALAWVEQQRQGEGFVFAFGDAWNFQRCLHFLHIGIPNFVAETRRVGQQLAKRDVTLRGTGLGFAVRIKTGQHAHMAEFRTDVFGWLVQLKVASFDTLHRSHRGDGLGHGCDPTHGVVGHGVARTKGSFTKSAFVQHTFSVSNGSGNTGDGTGLHACAEHGIDLRFHGHSGSPNNGFATCLITISCEL